MTTTETTYSLYAFLNSYHAYDGDNLDAFMAEWTERLGLTKPVREPFPVETFDGTCPSCGKEGSVQSVVQDVHVWDEAQVSEDGYLSFEGSYTCVGEDIDPHIACWDCNTEWLYPEKVEYR